MIKDQLYVKAGKRECRKVNPLYWVGADIQIWNRVFTRWGLGEEGHMQILATAKRLLLAEGGTGFPPLPAKQHLIF